MPEPTEPRPDHRLATEVGGHPVIPLPVRWHMGAHGDPIAEFDYITKENTMSKPTTITVDGDTYVRSDTVRDLSDSPVRIVIAQRGWVFVGRYTRDDEHVTLTNASVIRRWGTTKGLGELVDGPLADTVLDPCGTVEMHDLAVVATVACDAEKWAS